MRQSLLKALVKNTQAKPWLKNIEVLRIVSVSERQKTARISVVESVENRPVPELLTV